MANFDNLKKQAKLLVRWHRAGNRSVGGRIRSLPRYRNLTDPEALALKFPLSEAQEIIALEAGYANWAALKAGVSAVQKEALAEASLSLSLSWPGLLASRPFRRPLVGGSFRSCGPGWFSASWVVVRVFRCCLGEGRAPLYARRGCVHEGAWIDRGCGRWVGCFGCVGVLWGGVGGGPPSVDSEGASGVGPFGATLEAQVNPEEQETTCVRFEYGTSTAYGSSVPCANGSLGSGAEDTPASAVITGLRPGTEYHFRVVVENLSSPLGGTVGPDQTFTTPLVIGGEESFSEVTEKGAALSAPVDAGGVPTTYYFQYGPSAAYGSRTPGCDAVGEMNRSARRRVWPALRRTANTTSGSSPKAKTVSAKWGRIRCFVRSRWVSRGCRMGGCMKWSRRRKTRMRMSMLRALLAVSHTSIVKVWYSFEASVSGGGRWRRGCI